MEFDIAENQISYYPHKDIPNFIQRISSKKEFRNSVIKYPKSINNDEVLSTSNKLCNKENVILLPQQEFLKNFISPDTPYNGILIKHGTGAGKWSARKAQFLAKKYKSLMPTKEIGIHAHNNQQLAFANTIEAVIQNVNFLDGTIFGIGRAAGNCPLELLLGFLKNPKYDLRPILEILESHFVKLKEEIEWGYTIPYMITGILDLHPRAGMKLRKSDNRDNYLGFFDGLVESDSA